MAELDAVEQLFSSSAPKAEAMSVTPYEETKLTELRKREGVGYEQKQHPNSSAYGPYGLTSAAYQDVQNVNPYFSGKKISELTPQEHDQSVLSLHKDVIAPKLSQIGIEPTESNLQLAHFLGPVGAAAYLKNGYISPEAAAANGGMQKAQQIAQERLQFGAGLAQKHEDSQPKDDVEGLFLGKQMPKQETAPLQKPAELVAQPVVEKPVAEKPIVEKPVEKAQEIPQRSYADYAKETGKSVASFLDNTIGAVIPTAVGVIAHPFNKIIEVGARATGLDTKTEAADVTSAMVEPFSKPFAKAFGIDENDPAYKREITNRVMSFIGENVGEGAKELSDKFYDKTGLRIPASDLEYAANLGLMAATGKAGELGIKGVKSAKATLEDQFAAKQTEKTEPGFTGEKPVQAMEEQPTVQQQLTQQLEKKNIEQIPVQKAANESIANMEKTGNISVPEENPVMPKEKLSTQELASKEQILKDVGLTTIRKSALEGNPKEASSQFITSQADQGAYATGMTNQINHEKTALNNHFESLASESGGTVVRYGTPEEVSDKIQSGQKVKSGLEEGYTNWVKEGENLYKKAEEKHGDKPVSIEKFNEFLNKDENFAYTEEKGLQNAIKGYMQRKGLLDSEGSVRAMTVAEAEEVRKFINNKYHYETRQLGGQLKGLIDEQVFEQVGGETYQQARAHWGKGKEIYDNPKAIGDLLADKGVNQKIADEAVMNKVSALPESQFSHLVNTLKQDGQKAAISQIQTSLVDQVRRAGQSAQNQPWNSVAAAKEAAKISQKLRIAFADNPKALEKFYKGIEAGNILHIPNKYPGAAVQTHLLKSKFSDIALQRGLSSSLGAVGAGLGGAVGAGLGIAGGEAIGSKITGARKTARQEKQLKKELTKLKDIGKD